MKQYKVPAYYKAITLLEMLDKHTSKSPTWLRTEVFNQHKAKLVDLLVYIVQGVHQKETIPQNFLVALNDLEKLKIRLRAACDSHYITPAGFGEIARALEEVRRQIRAWGISSGMDKDALPKSFDLYDKSEKIEFIE